MPEYVHLCQTGNTTTEKRAELWYLSENSYGRQADPSFARAPGALDDVEGLARFTAADGTDIGAYTADKGFGLFAAATQVKIQNNEVVPSNSGVRLVSVSGDLLPTDGGEVAIDARRDDSHLLNVQFGLIFRRKDYTNNAIGEGIQFAAEAVSASLVNLVIRRWGDTGINEFSANVALNFAWALSASKRLGVILNGAVVTPYVEDVGGGNRQTFSPVTLDEAYTAAAYGRYGLLTQSRTGQRFDNLVLLLTGQAFGATTGADDGRLRWRTQPFAPAGPNGLLKLRRLYVVTIRQFGGCRVRITPIVDFTQRLPAVVWPLTDPATAAPIRHTIEVPVAKRCTWVEVEIEALERRGRFDVAGVSAAVAPITVAAGSVVGIE